MPASDPRPPQTTEPSAEEWRAKLAEALGREAALLLEVDRLRRLLRETLAREQALEARMPRADVELRYQPHQSRFLASMKEGEA